MKNKDSRIRRLMMKWKYTPILNPPVDIDRHFKINSILNDKSKFKWQTFYNCKNGSIEYNERMEVFNWWFKLNKSTDDIKDIWLSANREKYSGLNHRTKYDIMPKRERRDNAHPELYGRNLGSSGSNISSIRVPSKKRINKWKNFRKLFPDFCEKRGL